MNIINNFYRIFMHMTHLVSMFESLHLHIMPVWKWQPLSRSSLFSDFSLSVVDQNHKHSGHKISHFSGTWGRPQLLPLTLESASKHTSHSPMPRVDQCMFLGNCSPTVPFPKPNILPKARSKC